MKFFDRMLSNFTAHHEGLFDSEEINCIRKKLDLTQAAGGPLGHGAVALPLALGPGFAQAREVIAGNP